MKKRKKQFQKRRILSVVFICAMLVNMSGCGMLAAIVGKEEGKESTQMELPEIITRPREEIENTGITAADVLGRLDEIIQMVRRCRNTIVNIKPLE